MGWIVAYKNDFCLTGYEYFSQVVNDNGSVSTYHDPNMATVFRTKKIAKTLSDKLDLDTVIVNSGDHKEMFENCTFKYREIKTIDESLNVPFNDDMSLEDVIEWNIKYRKVGERSVTQDIFDSYHFKIHDLSNHIWDLTGYNDKDYNLIVTFSVYTNRDGDFDKFKADLDLILDKVELKNEDGYLKLPIFDHELNQYEQRFLYYKSDTDCKVGGRYDKYTGSLNYCFDRMKKDYYYE